MKALLLAAGLGTRLRPITDTVPKCLVPIAGEPLLDIWLDNLARSGVDQVIVNLHHLADLVVDHLGRRRGPPEVHTVHEPQLLGSAGTLRANRDLLAEDGAFLVVNADNLTDFDVRALVEAHREHEPLATLTAFEAPRPEECGILRVQDGWMVGFEEKPSRPRSRLANAGMYAFHPEVIDLVSGAGPRDIGFHLLPQLVGRARVVDLGDAYFVDVGNPEALARASRDWKAVKVS